MIEPRPTERYPLRADQIWLVDYECRTDAIRINAECNGFYAFGQDAVWGFTNVQKWHRCLYDPAKDVAANGKTTFVLRTP